MSATLGRRGAPVAHLTLDQARPGMILATDVMDRRGRLLVPRGKELTERHLGALRMWGVPNIEIEGDDPESDGLAPIDAEVLGRAEAEVAEIFANAREAHPFLDTLRGLSVARRARDIAAEQVGV